MSLARLSEQGTGFLFRENGRRIMALTTNPIKSKVRIFTSVTTIPLIARIPYYSKIFNIVYDDDNYNQETILMVRGSQARHLIDLFLLAAISPCK